MYNRYIPNGASYTRIPEEDAPPVRTPPEPERPDGGVCEREQAEIDQQLGHQAVTRRTSSMLPRTRMCSASLNL